MNRSTTAVVLSALVLPGAGQLYLKHVWRGMAFIGVSLVCLWLIVVRTMQQASAVLAQIETQGGALDAAQLAGLMSQTQGGSGSWAATAAVWVLLVCWVAAIIDTHLLGKREAIASAPVQ